LLSLFCAGHAAPQCKAMPGTADWPSDAEWAGLNTAVGGKLLKPNAPAAGCHRGQPGYSTDACTDIKDGWKDSAWHAKHPTSGMWQNYNNYSCMPDASASCSTAGYPIYVVEARNPQDVQAAVNFARTRNVRLNIKSTGHDFLGRSTQPNSLSIWTHQLKSIKWHETTFTPKGCRSVINGPAATVGAGAKWGDVYSSARGKDYGVVGGAFNSVSLGGYLQNGGHGALSAKYGLGADMVLEIELVTAAGEIITANECQNTEYFWAMRGGGGSTYGVATAFTIQALPKQTSARFNGKLEGWDQIVHMHRSWPALARVGGSGYIRGYPGRSGEATWSVSVPNMTANALRAIVDPIPRRPAPGVATGRYVQFESLAEAIEASNAPAEAETANAVQAGFPGMGGSKIMASWLWSAADVAQPELAQAIRGAFGTDTYMLTDATMGVGTWNPPFMRGGGNAVNPAFRTAVMRPAAEVQWEGADQRELARRKEEAARYGLSLRRLAPEAGTYANEADPDAPGWQWAFWGANYDKLWDIKHSVDPTGVFWCRACVGSESWVEVEGLLCR
ncbi:FAD-binding domain-containing protein, partial [Trichodelitschia bisporula]